MTKRLQSITNKLYPVAFIALIVLLWELVCLLGVVEEFMLPSPKRVLSALISERSALLHHSITTLSEAGIGLFASIFAAFVIATLMDRFEFLYKAGYPALVLTQTVPTVAIAPLLVLWLGYGMLPKIVLIFITCFFPMLVALLGGFKTADGGVLRLFRSMGAGYFRVLFDVKLPYALDSFFSGLRISVSYAVVGAVIAEWLGGNAGLGVYMTRVRKSFAFHKMIAVIIVISVISLILMKLVDLLQAGCTPWKKYEKN